MKSRFIGEQDMDSAMWDYLVNELVKVDNRLYSEIIIEIGKEMAASRRPMFGQEEKLIINFAGISCDDYMDVNFMARDGSTAKLEAQVLNEKAMLKEGWVPSYNTGKTFIICWAKAPFVYSCIELSGAKPSVPLKELVAKVLNEVKRIPAYARKSDMAKMTDDINKLMSKISRHEVIEAKKNMDANMRKIADYNSALSALYAQVNKARAEMTLTRKPKLEMKDTGKMLSKLLAIKGVKGISVENDMVNVLTDNLQAPFPTKRDDDHSRKESKDIGRFVISWGVGKSITIKNLDKHPDYSYDHPHVDEGIPCWGNMSGIIKYAQRMEIDVVIQMIIAYLQAVDANHAYADPYEWVREFRTGEAYEKDEDDEEDEDD